jgi:hypothetical protein
LFDLAVPNSEPGPCAKCRGSGVYRWGAIVNGRATHQGRCHSCKGTGKQTVRDIHRNVAYNRHKVGAVMAADFRISRASAEPPQPDEGMEYGRGAPKMCNCERGDGEPNVACTGRCPADPQWGRY